MEPGDESRMRRGNQSAGLSSTPLGPRKPRPTSQSTETRRGRSTIDTACPLDCPDACSLAVSVEGGRLAKIDGSSRNRVTRGFICAKVRRFAERVSHARRLTHPARRKGPKGRGGFERLDWREALSTIAARIEEVRREWGGEAILPFSYGGSNGLLTQDTIDGDLFGRLGASRLARTVCAAPTGAAHEAMYGKMPGVAYDDYMHARLIVVWGANPSISSIHLVPFIREAQRRGAKLVVVDPRRTQLARHADLHLAVRPGTDLPLALALIRYLFETGRADDAFLQANAIGADSLRAAARAWTFEQAARECSVAADQVAAFAELYATMSPAVIRCGWGLERNRNGGHAVLAVLTLPAVAGKFGVRGGGFTMSNSSAWAVDRQRWAHQPETDTRIVNMNKLGRALTEYRDPPIKLLFVYNCNPLATMPDQNRVLEGLLREDLFTIVFDQVRTDTADYADMLLPATTFLEHYDIVPGYGSYSLQLVRPIVEAAGEARTNPEVFGQLAECLGFHAEESEAETLLRVAAGLPEGVRDALLADEVVSPPCGLNPVQFVDLFPATADGKVNLFPRDLRSAAPDGLYAYQPDPGTREFPLALISPATEKTISSTLGELQQDVSRLLIHPADADPRGIATDDPIRVFNGLGEVHCLAKVTDEITPGTVSLPKGLWRHHVLNHSTANALVPDQLSDLGGGACFNDARVEIAKLASVALGDERLAVWVASQGTRQVS
ncbi:MAG: molybdopterin-dependent oxidoreductase [Luteitalea sp.]|nr:molybdopterin-dependent oxidoreductase [Luteitalea sp.]